MTRETCFWCPDQYVLGVVLLVVDNDPVLDSLPVELGDCGRAYGSSCVHEHSRLGAACGGPIPPSGSGSPRSATTCWPASPKPNARAGSARSKVSSQPRRRRTETLSTRPTLAPSQHGQ